MNKCNKLRKFTFGKVKFSDYVECESSRMFEVAFW